MFNYITLILFKQQQKIKNFSILWQKECGESTNCLLYDTDSLRLFLFFKLISFSLIIFKKIIRHVISLSLSESGFRCILMFPFEQGFSNVDDRVHHADRGVLRRGRVVLLEVSRHFRGRRWWRNDERKSSDKRWSRKRRSQKVWSGLIFSSLNQTKSYFSILLNCLA